MQRLLAASIFVMADRHHHSPRTKIRLNILWAKTGPPKVNISLSCLFATLFPDQELNDGHHFAGVDVMKLVLKYLYMSNLFEKSER